MATSKDEDQSKRDRRRRLWQGLLLGGAAVSVPALVNALVARRAKPLAPARWGRGHRYAAAQGDLAFQKVGQGEPVVVVHSFGPGASCEEWRGVAEDLGAEYEVYAPDLLGWGHSDKPRIVYDGELYLRQLVDFLQDVVRRPAVVAAAGLPAAYAVLAANDHPELIRGLALICPLGLEARAEEPDLRDALLHRTLRLPILGTSMLNLYTSRTALTRYLRQEVFAAPERADAGLIDYYYRAAHQPGANYALTAYLCGFLNVNVEIALSRLKQPLWLGWGRHAVEPPVEAADLWLRERSDAELEVFEECGALPHLEAPSHVSTGLQAFIGSLPG